MQSMLKSIITAFIILGLFLSGVYIIDKKMLNSSYNALYTELKQAAEHCYAVEGRYPPDLQYIEKHYGIKIDNRRFSVDYRRTSPDRSPEIKISISKVGAWA